MQGRQRYSHHMNAAIHMCETWHLEHKCDGHVIHTCNHHISNWSLVCDLSKMPVIPLTKFIRSGRNSRISEGGIICLRFWVLGYQRVPKNYRFWFYFHKLTLTPLCSTWQKMRWSKVLICRVKDIPDPALPCVQGWLTLYLHPPPRDTL